MKKLFLLPVFAFFILFNVQAQDTNDSSVLDKKDEIRLSVIKLLAGPIFETSYERVIDSNQGFGATLLLNLDTKNDYLEDYSITPFYRMYFQTKEDYGAKGFFVEGFASFFGGDNDNAISSIINQTQDDKFFDVSLGLGLGKKWINTAGFVFEAKFGVGRNLLNESVDDFLIKGDLSIGYRF